MSRKPKYGTKEGWESLDKAQQQKEEYLKELEARFTSEVKRYSAAEIEEYLKQRGE